MGRIRTIARRTFLIGSAAAAGGLIVGWIAWKWPIANPLLKDLEAGDVTLNPYVRISPTGISIIAPRADVGQGIHSMLAAMVAEELDVAWGGFTVEHGPPSAAYYNEAILAEGVPFAATNDGFVARRVRGLTKVVTKLVGMQVTGGSTSVPDGFEKMRVAGAVARQMLLAAAAKQTGVAVGSLRTEAGAVITPDGTRLEYTALAAAAAVSSTPSNVTLKDPSEWKLLGKPHQRLDIEAKSTGRFEYGIDMRMPGMVYATVRTNPRIGGGMTSMDDAAAKASKGVIKVVPVKGGVGVVADNTWRAFQAAAQLKPQWGAAPYPATSQEIWDVVAASFVKDRQDSRFKDEGDIEAALATDGATKLDAEYRIPFLAHAPLEPMTSVARFADGKLEVWASTQMPRFAVGMAAKAAGIEPEAVTLHTLPSGGSFGRRLETDYIEQVTQLAVAHPGVPVKLTWTREEDMTHDFPRPLGMSRARGAVKDGKIVAYALDIAAPAVASSQMGRLGLSVPGPDIAIVAGAWDQPYGIPNYRVTGYRVPETVPVSSWRSVGASGNGFLHDCFLDELIVAAGADPLRERIRLCTHDASRRVLEAVGEMSGWGTPLPAGRGRGVAFVIAFGVPVAEVVEVTNAPAGITIDRVFLACDVGRVLDPVNFENQVQGGVIWGLGHAVNAELTYADGMAQQTNFHQFDGIRLRQVPEIIVQAVKSGSRIHGIGEPPVPPAAPALANAIFAATGQRIRELPLRKHINFA